jgi:hypothetical protein
MGVTGLENKIANFIIYHSHLWKENKNNNEECINLHWTFLGLLNNIYIYKILGISMPIGFGVGCSTFNKSIIPDTP